MNTIKLSVTKIALGVVTLITLATLFSNTASAGDSPSPTASSSPIAAILPARPAPQLST
jgi:hypothetical protein